MSDPEGTEAAAQAPIAKPEASAIEAGSSASDQSTVVVVGLGNPGERYIDTPHNVGQRHRGEDGGHRGVRSIVQTFQNDKFRRVKIGIRKPGAGQLTVDYVLLTPFPPEQLVAMDVANRAAADRVIELIRQASTSRSSLTRGEKEST